VGAALVLVLILHHGSPWFTQTVVFFVFFFFFFFNQCLYIIQVGESLLLGMYKGPGSYFT
jgi:hypothetical protein